MRIHSLLALTSLLVLAAVLPGTAVRAQEASPADPRMEQARALLGDREDFARAAELFRAILDDSPDDVEVRLLLARVLSWSERYDESVAEYERLLAAPEPPLEARVERAEVLSWAGRMDEAQREFEALLAAEPEHARAARGLARVLNWSGQTAAADRAYARALELERDDEAGAEWAVLRAGYAPTASASFGIVSDNDGFEQIWTSAEVSYFPDLDTRLLTRLSLIRVEHPRDFETEETLGLPERDRAYQLALAVERRLGERWRGELEVGGRLWERAAASPLARARLEYTARSDAVLSLAVDHRDLLERSESLAAVEDGVRGTAATLAIWKGFTPQLEAYAQVGASAYSDSNLRHGAAVNTSFKPWPDRALRLHLRFDYLGFAENSDLYYDPRSDLSSALAVTHRFEFPGELKLNLEASAGYGRATQDGVKGSGPAYSVGADLFWRRGRWRFSLRGSHAQSRRRTVYISNRLTARVGVDF